MTTSVVVPITVPNTPNAWPVPEKIGRKIDKGSSRRLVAIVDRCSEKSPSRTW